MSARLIFAALALFPFLARAAETSYNIATTDGSQVTIRLSTPLTSGPRFGFFPLRIWIDNRSSQNGRWDLRFHSGTRDGFPGAVDTSLSIEIPAGQNKETWYYIPLAAAGVSVAPSVTTTSASSSTFAGLTGLVSTLTPMYTVSPTGSLVVSGFGPAAVPAAGSGAGASPAGSIETTARARLATTDLLTVPATAHQTYSILPIPNSTPGSSFALFLVEQTGPAADLPRPVSSALPPGIVVNVHPAAVAGMVIRTITYMDAAELGSLIGKDKAFADLVRYGYLRDQPMVTVGQMTATSGFDRGMSTVQVSSFSIAETGPPQLLPLPGPAALPPGVSVQLVPMPNNSANVMRYFFTTNAAPLTASNIARVIVSGGGTVLTSSTGAVSYSTTSGVVTSASLAPAPTVMGAIDPSNITAEIDGFGLSAAQTVNLTIPLVNSALPTPPIAVAPRIEVQLRNRIGGISRGAPVLSAIDPFIVPADWRLWSSFHAMVMQARDLRDLDAPRVAALRQWVAMGGLLLLVPGRDDTRIESSEHIGAGSIETIPYGLQDVDPFYLTTKLQLNQLSLGLPPRESMRFFSSSPLAAAVEAGNINNTSLAIVLGVFGFLIGPLNLFVFARAKKRHRLFITTPILALLGAAALGVLIVHEDGFGGEGIRSAVVAFIPNEPMAAVFQDQVARTGFLSSRDFALDDKAMLVGIPVAEYDPSGRDSSLRRESGVASGDWFRNRWRQAHHLRALIPTRARVEIVSVTPAGVPIVQSTLTTTLTEFYYITADGKIWKADSVPPGRGVTLEATDLQLKPLMTVGATRNLDALLFNASLREEGRWFAKGGASDFAPIQTLPTVRWTESTIYYTGVALPKPPPKTATAQFNP